MQKISSAFIVGLVFGLGLIVAEMSNPARVLGFLDVSGRWDPTLAFVMGGALIITAAGFRLVLSRDKPLFGEVFSFPSSRRINVRLLMGAALFGVGWGLAGLCPGPAIVGLGALNEQVMIFVVAMFVGMKLFDFWPQKEV